MKVAAPVKNASSICAATLGSVCKALMKHLRPDIGGLSLSLVLILFFYVSCAAKAAYPVPSSASSLVADPFQTSHIDRTNAGLQRGRQLHSVHPADNFASTKERMRIILTGVVPGGLGNQFETILEHLSVVKQHKLEYVFPHMISRKGLVPIPPETVWNLDKLRKVVPTLHWSAPSQCRKQTSQRLDLHVSSKPNLTESNNFSMRVVKRSNAVIHVEISRYGLQHVRDLREMIKKLAVEAADKSINGSQLVVCMEVSPHVHEADWKISPYLQASNDIAAAARKWPLSRLGVVHLRYDEHRCGKGPPRGVDPNNHICVLAQKSRVVLWIPLDRYVQALQNIMTKHQVNWIYLTKSPYMPPAMWEKLKSSFEKNAVLKVARTAALDYHGETLNYVEREIAFQCRLFLGESHSTWSKAIMYSRNNSMTMVTSALFEN